ncbi:MAG: adenosyl-hopene transferase HpnH [Desulfovibrionaceae bacterium]|nr:adenosyl-hopene transferase HpnH [Desulfovibrionaceae bacterium]
MGIPAMQKARIGAYIMKMALRGVRRYPLVLMLEPLFQCNLNCKGCGKIAHPPEVLEKRLSVDQCLAAAEECGAPVISLPGGEPLLHKDIHIIVRELVRAKRFVYLCTNAQLVHKRIHEFTPSPYLTFNVHLDGLGARHDRLVQRKGAFDIAVRAVEALLERGFRVTTNTTLFNDHSPEDAAELFDFLTGLGIEGLTVSPGFSYQEAQDQGNFLGRGATVRLFRDIFELGKNRNWVFSHSSLYLDFLAGNQDYACSPWGNPTYNVLGWQRPCYLLADGYAASFDEFMQTDWGRCGLGRDPRCADCMCHCGFEPTAVIDSVQHPIKALRAAQQHHAAERG